MSTCARLCVCLSVKKVRKKEEKEKKRGSDQGLSIFRVPGTSVKSAASAKVAS